MSEERPHDWYAKEWIEFAGSPPAKPLLKGIMSPSSFSELIKGKTQHVRLQDLAAVAEFLNRAKPDLAVEPPELLMPPAQAMALRPFAARWRELAGLSPEQVAEAIDYASFRTRRGSITA